jgi:hypothetical protein
MARQATLGCKPRGAGCRAYHMISSMHHGEMLLGPITGLPDITGRTPVAQSPGISQILQNPRMWSMRYAWKYWDKFSSRRFHLPQQQIWQCYNHPQHAATSCSSHQSA